MTATFLNALNCILCIDLVSIMGTNSIESINRDSQSGKPCSDTVSESELDHHYHRGHPGRGRGLVQRGEKDREQPDSQEVARPIDN
jgi:hypothetical protein